MLEQETQNIKQNKKEFIHIQPRHKNENIETAKSWILFFNFVEWSFEVWI